MLKALVISFLGAIFFALIFAIYVMGMINLHRDAERKKKEKARIQAERKAKLEELRALKEEKEQQRAEAIANAKKHVSGRGREEKNGVMEAGVDLSVPEEPQVSDQPKVSKESFETSEA